MRMNEDASCTPAKPNPDTPYVFDRIWSDIEQRIGSRVTVTSHSGSTKLERIIELLWSGETKGKKMWLYRIDIRDRTE